MREAVIESHAPLLQFNGERLLDDIYEARKQRKAARLANSGVTGEYVVFFSYAQMDSAAETTLFYNEAIQRLPKEKVFHDNNAMFKLNDLITKVKQSKNVIVLLSANYCKRPYTLVELHAALQSGVNVIPVIIEKPDTPSFQFKEVNEDILSRKIQYYLSVDGWNLLKDFEITIDNVIHNLQFVMNVRAISSWWMRPS